MTLLLHSLIEKAIIKELQLGYPAEGFGFLYSSHKTDGGNPVVDVALPSYSLVPSDLETFSEDFSDYLALAVAYGVENNFSLRGIYVAHSDHSAIPVERDVMLIRPELTLLIVAVKKGKAKGMKAWQLSEAGRFVEQSLEVKLDELDLKNLFIYN